MTRASEYTRDEVLRLLGVSEEFLLVLERERLVPAPRAGRYAPPALERIRVCWNLHEELGVNLAGLEVIMGLLERIQAERRQFRDVMGWLQGQLHGP